MSKIYENMYIGAFILSLGYKMGTDRREANMLSSLNLFQQTPIDPLLGDMFVNLSGLNVLIEFKRDSGLLAGERDKPSRSHFRELLMDDEFKRISKECHFVGYGIDHAALQVSMEFATYCSLFIDDTPLIVSPLETFLTKLISQEIGVATSELQAYVERLSSGGDPAGSTCLIVNFQHEAGVRLFLVDQLREVNILRERIRQTPERQREEPQVDNTKLRIRQ